VVSNLPDYISVTEIAGDEVSQEQVQRICNRYYWAGQYCKGMDILEVACGTGQGLGYLTKLARSLIAGDYSEDILEIARRHYENRLDLRQFDAQDMPFEDNSFDVVILFEAIYYIPDAEQFVSECSRVLRPGGKVLIATANKDLYDFNPSPYTHKYYGTIELNKLFTDKGFSVELFGNTPINQLSVRQKVLRPIKKIATSLHLIPGSMKGKKFLKRIMFGELVRMPAEIDEGMAEYQPPAIISHLYPDKKHKVIYCVATLIR
jgi:SAM-dependent methyltransferase